MSVGLYWGEGGQFGPFEAQPDGWPNAGQVMRHFREKLGISAAEFARMYSEELAKQGSHKKGKPGKEGEVTAIWILNMEKQNSVPNDITRRRIISQFLNIPPALFGLAELSHVIVPLQTRAQASSLPASKTVQRTAIDISHFQRNISVALQLHKANHAHELTEDIQANLRVLSALEAEARGDLLYQVRELLIGNHLLASRIARDQRQYTQAYLSANNAVHIAKRMDDPDVLGSSRHTRGLVLLAWGQSGHLHQGQLQDDRDKIQRAAAEYAEATQQLQAALVTCSSIQSAQNMVSIANKCSQLLRSPYGAFSDVRELADMLYEWYGITLLEKEGL